MLPKLPSMAAKVYKPAAEVNLGPDSDEFYISPNVKGSILPCIQLVLDSGVRFLEILNSLFLKLSLNFLLFLVSSSCSSAPRVAGLLVKIFVWILEMPIIGSMVLYILKKDNLINKVQHCSNSPQKFALFFREKKTPFDSGNDLACKTVTTRFQRELLRSFTQKEMLFFFIISTSSSRTSATGT